MSTPKNFLKSYKDRWWGSGCDGPGHNNEAHRGYGVWQQGWEVPKLGQGKFKQGGRVQGTPEVKAAWGPKRNLRTRETAGSA